MLCYPPLLSQDRAESLIGILRHIKLDPNPRGQENFFFINALNEWGEGNVLEPSIQWGSKFSKAFRAAKDYADTSLPWVDDLIRQGEELEPEVMDETSQVDVCVIVRDFRASMPWSDVWQLQQTLWSLQAQHNPRWRAVVVPVGEETWMRGIETQVLDTYDPRIKSFDIPEGLRYDNETNSADDITDWVIENIGELSPSCGRATYMLVANASTTYEPHTFDVASRKRTDIIGLNFISPSTMALQNQRESNLTWDERCSRYSEKSPLQLCQPMHPKYGALDISAALVRLTKWRKEQLTFKAAAKKYGVNVNILAELEKRRVDRGPGRHPQARSAMSSQPKHTQRVVALGIFGSTDQMSEASTQDAIAAKHCRWHSSRTTSRYIGTTRDSRRRTRSVSG